MAKQVYLLCTDHRYLLLHHSCDKIRQNAATGSSAQETGSVRSRYNWQSSNLTSPRSDGILRQRTRPTPIACTYCMRSWHWTNTQTDGFAWIRRMSDLRNINCTGKSLMSTREMYSTDEYQDREWSMGMAKPSQTYEDGCGREWSAAWPQQAGTERKLQKQR
jgi:hypothetical protein